MNDAEGNVVATGGASSMILSVLSSSLDLPPVPFFVFYILIDFSRWREFNGNGANQFVLSTDLQTTNQAAATDLSRTINLIKDFVPGLIEQLPAILGKAAGAAVARAENVTINPHGDTVEIRIELKTK